MRNELPGILPFELRVNEIPDLPLEPIGRLTHQGDCGRRDQSFAQNTHVGVITLDRYLIDAPSAALCEQKRSLTDESKPIRCPQGCGCRELGDLCDTAVRLPVHA